MTKEELIKAWATYRGEANVTTDQLQALDFAWKMYWEQNYSVTDIENEYKRLMEMDEKKIDWEQRRYDIAKTMLPCVTTLRYNASEDGGINPVTCAGDAVICADMLIEDIYCITTNNKTTRNGNCTNKSMPNVQS